MNNLLFTALIIALLYYFFYYLPSQKKLNPNPTTTKLTHSQFTQTDEYEPGPSDTLNGPEAVQFPSAQFEKDPEIKKLQQDIQQKEQTIIRLDEKLKELNDAESNLDQLIKGMQDLGKELN